jgi:hypothetical protein
MNEWFYERGWYAQNQEITAKGYALHDCHPYKIINGKSIPDTSQTCRVLACYPDSVGLSVFLRKETPATIVVLKIE